MKRPIGFDVANIQKVTKSLSSEEEKKPDTTPKLADIDEHVLRLSGEVLALQGMVHHLINSQSIAQQEMFLADLLSAMNTVKKLKMSPTATKVQDYSLEMGESITDLIKVRLKALKGKK